MRRKNTQTMNIKNLENFLDIYSCMFYSRTKQNFGMSDECTLFLWERFWCEICE